jgi:NAD+ kinase
MTANGDYQRPARVGVTFNPQLARAKDLALRLGREIEARGVDVWVDNDGGPDQLLAFLPGTDLLICLGGDGTVLRAARLVIGQRTPILGVNLGRLGFLTELDGEQALERLDEVLAGTGRIEERMMIKAQVAGKPEVYHGLNEAVIGRATFNRAIHLAVDVDGSRIGDYRCDGVIIASPTGSTAYALSVGGPILPPESRDIVIVPVAPHLAAQHAVVLPGSETVHITLEPGQLAVLSVDGLSDVDLHEGDSVVVSASEHHARFLRLNPRSDFYIRMAAQLGWHRPGGNALPLPAAAYNNLE